MWKMYDMVIFLHKCAMGQIVGGYDEQCTQSRRFMKRPKVAIFEEDCCLATFGFFEFFKRENHYGLRRQILSTDLHWFQHFYNSSSILGLLRTALKFISGSAECIRSALDHPVDSFPELRAIEMKSYKKHKEKMWLLRYGEFATIFPVYRK